MKCLLFLIFANNSGETLYKQMIDTLHNAQTVSYRVNVKEYTKNKKDTSYSYFKVTLKKPSYGEKPSLVKCETQKGFLVYNKERKIYLSLYGAATPNESIGICSSGGGPMCNITQNTYFEPTSCDPRPNLTIGQTLTAIGPYPILEPQFFFVSGDYWESFFDSVTNEGTDTLGNEELNVIQISLMNGQRVQKYWLSKYDHLPRKITHELIVSDTMIVEEIWDSVYISQPISDTVFVWKPTKDWKRKDFKFFIDNQVLANGTKAPVFSCQSITGDTISVPNSRSKFVWLFFWKAGCPPCREGMPAIQKLYDELKNKGIFIVGFDWVDDKELALKYIKDNKLTFPIILDTTETGKAIADQYRAGQFPTHYIIDKDGNIFESFVGYDGNDYKDIADILRDGKDN